MNLELNCEHPEPGEDKPIEKMLMLATQRMKPQQGRSVAVSMPMRQVASGGGHHPQRSPSDLRHWVFGKPNQVFQAIIRFSNDGETINPDGKGDAGEWPSSCWM